MASQCESTGSVGHFDAKHILIQISGDNEKPDLIRMQPEIKNKTKHFNTPETQIRVQTVRPDSGFCILVEFEVTTTDL